MCYTPISLKKNNKNLIAPCGKCSQCIQRNRAEWMCRNLIHAKYHEHALFATFTYSNDCIKELPYNDKADLHLRHPTHMRNYLSNLRYYIPDLSYYGVHEYGDNTQRPHYHLIIYTDSDDSHEKIESLWKYGYTSLYPAKQQAIHYVSGYVQKETYYNRVSISYLDYLTNTLGKNDPKYLESYRNRLIFEETKKLMSRRPAIGHQLLDDQEMVNWIREQALTNNSYPRLELNGNTYRLPRYYIKKLFSDEEREKIYNLYLDNYNDELINESKKQNKTIKQLKRDKQHYKEMKLKQMNSRVEKL